ncbi:MAG: ABC transporter permease [Oscillospiraceae bacterium]|nr:ABC transporter permease [Oscillospiraceae bacterium]
MRQSWLVARFTFREAVRKRAFWITNIIYLIMLLGMMIIMPLVGGMDGGDMNLNFGEGGFSNATAYLLDESGSHYLAPVRHSLENLGMTVVEITPAQLEDSLVAISEDAGAAVVHITANEYDTLHAEIIMRDMMSRFPANGVGALINMEFRHAQLVEAGVDHEVSISILQSEVMIEPVWQAGFAAMGASLVLMMIMFMSVHSYGTSVAMSVATEKSTRVMETLIVSAKPPRILVGKVIGMGSVGLVQMLGLIIIAGLLSALTSGADAPVEMSMGDINLWVAPLLLLYFLAGYALYALINAMLGAMVSKLEDLNSALAPAAIITMISFYAGGLGPMITGGGQVGRAVMLFPFTAPFAAPTVLLNNDFDPSVVLPSILILVGSVVLLSWLAGKVYSASVLHYGSRLKYKDVGKLVKGNKK